MYLELTSKLLLGAYCMHYFSFSETMMDTSLKKVFDGASFKINFRGIPLLGVSCGRNGKNSIRWPTLISLVGEARPSITYEQMWRRKTKIQS